MEARTFKGIVIATAITMFLSAIAASADTRSSNIVQQAPKFSQTQPSEAHVWPKSYLFSLATSGTLTQAQEDAIQSAILNPPKVSVAKGKLKRGDRGGFKTVSVGLVKAETLTQTQEGTIQGAITL